CLCIVYLFVMFIFFSSRRRHTRFDCDWSSDVCSSDLYDAELAPSALRQDRPLDVLFVGGYSRHHKQRAAVLEAVASMAHEYNVVFHLDRSRLCRLAESPLGRLMPLAKHRRPSPIRAVTREPIFGRDYYGVLSSAKIVLNGSIDMPSADR